MSKADELSYIADIELLRTRQAETNCYLPQRYLSEDLFLPLMLGAILSSIC